MKNLEICFWAGALSVLAGIFVGGLIYLGLNTLPMGGDLTKLLTTKGE